MIESQKAVLLKIFSIFGMLGPCVFFFVIILLGYLWPGYNSLVFVLSTLGAVYAPHAIIMNVFGFEFLSICMVLFSIALYISIKKHILTSIGVILLFSSGLIFFILSIIPCDPGCLHLTLSAQLHRIISYIANFTLPMGIVVLTYPLKIDKKWGNAWLYFYLELITFLTIALPIALIPGGLMLAGLFQRLGMGLILFWMFIISIKIFQFAKQGNINQ